MLNAIKVVKLPSFGVVSLLKNMLSFYLTLPKVSTSIPSLGEPVVMRTQTTDLILQTPYQPQVGWKFFLYTTPNSLFSLTQQSFWCGGNSNKQVWHERVDSVWWWRFHSNTSFSQSTIMSDIYLTLPSNNWSIKYFPNNKKQFMKNR